MRRSFSLFLTDKDSTIASSTSHYGDQDRHHAIANIDWDTYHGPTDRRASRACPAKVPYAHVQ
jgi:hypothetical protein